jgi:ureidoacrylate peracid hydrolase
VGIKCVVVVGIAANVGVEWTLREAMSREYFGVLIEDATLPAGPAEIQKATVFNVEKFICWVANVAAFETACNDLAKLQAPPGRASPGRRPA